MSEPEHISAVLARMAAAWDRAASTSDAVGDRARPNGDRYRGYAEACRKRATDLAQGAEHR